MLAGIAGSLLIGLEELAHARSSLSLEVCIWFGESVMIEVGREVEEDESFV